jgi:hypothetical protein
MFLEKNQMANAVRTMKSICCMMCIVRDCAAKIIKLCLRQKRFATDCTDLHGLWFLPSAERDLPQKHRNVICIFSVISVPLWQ